MKCLKGLFSGLTYVAKAVLATTILGFFGIAGGILGAYLLLWLLPIWSGWSVWSSNSDAIVGAVFGATASLVSGFVVVVVAYVNIEYQRNKENQKNSEIRSRALSDLPLALHELALLCKSLEKKIAGFDNSNDENRYTLSSISLDAIQMAIEHSKSEDREEFRKILYYYKITKLHFNDCMTKRERRQKNNAEHFEWKHDGDEVDLIRLVLSFRAIVECYIKPAIQGKIKFRRENAQKRYKEYTEDFNEGSLKQGTIEFSYDFDNVNCDIGFLNPTYLEKNLGKF